MQAVDSPRARPRSLPRPFLPVRSSRSLAAGLFALVALGTGCSGGGGGATQDQQPDSGFDPTVAETLEMLGIDTDPGPALDDVGNALPASYAPWGTIHDLGKIGELGLFGVRRAGSSEVVSLLEDGGGQGDAEPWAPLYELAEEDAPWALDPQQIGLPPISRRSTVAADLDGDGREEQAVVHFDELGLHLVVIADRDGGFETTETLLLAGPTGIVDVVVAAGDLHGTGREDLVLGYTLPTEGVLRLVQRDEQGFVLAPEPSRSFPAEFVDSVVLLDLEIGRLDYDAPEEIALVTNEYTSDASFRTARASRWYVLDDVGSELSVASSGLLEATDEFDVLRTALVADVGVGDVDGDGLDEVVLGGLWNPDAWVDDASYVLAARDDLPHGFAPLGPAAVVEHAIGHGRLGWAAVGTADLEGDRAREVYVNNAVFADFKDSAPWTVRGELGFWSTELSFLDTTTVAMTAGDVTGDGRDDVACLVQGSSAGCQVYGIPEDAPDQELQLLHAIPVGDAYSGPGWNPILFATNPDSDTTVLRLEADVPAGQGGFGSRLVFSEPVVLAVLAAPPYMEGIGQNIDACSTQFGQGESETTEHTFEIGFSVGSIFGFDGSVPLVGGAELEVSVKHEFNWTYQDARTETRSISYSTGPREDTVICSVTPYDQYFYRVVSNSDPTLVDEVIIITLPRDPIVVQLERGYYNSVVASDRTRIDETVLPHEPGELLRYRSLSSVLEISTRTPVLTSGIVTVGQGSGSSTVDMAVTTESGWDFYHAFSAEWEIKANVSGIVVGGSVGFNLGHSHAWLVGSETTYSGTVGNIDSAHYGDNIYSYGLFSYVHQDPGTGAAFQVLDYWVDL